ncbi:MAG: hypothetical protein ACE5GE_04455 [Phycisphaerae bacterium]
MTRYGPMLLAAAALSVTGCSMFAEHAYRQDMAGKAPPGFELTTLEGETVSLRSLGGKPVVLAFFGLG